MNREPQGITLKNPNVSSSAEKIEEEDECVNVAVSTVDKMEAPPDPKFPFLAQIVPPLALCWVTLLLIMSLRIYFTSVILENNTKITAENQELESQRKNLTEQNQELESQRKNLTEQIRDMKTKWKEDNVTRAQWSIDTYCPKNNNGRQCNACQSGWINKQSSCYAIHDAKGSDQKTWEEARENCTGINSDLAVLFTEGEKKFTTDNSWNNPGISGYWIGLKVEDGRWKWVDGSNLTNNSWIGPPVNGTCVISFQGQGWRSVSCDTKNAWICKKKALSV